jgi:hypothetical protein
MTNPPPSPYDAPPPVGAGSPRPHRHSAWLALGAALATTLCMLGLMIVAAGVIFVIGLNSYGSNK